MNLTKKRMLQKHREKIVKDLEANDILDDLYSQRILSSDDLEKIRSQKERSYRVRCLLDILIQGKDNAYSVFVDILSKDYSWLSKELTTPIGCANELEYEEQLYHDALTLGNVPQLPLHYIPRTGELNKLKESLKQLKRNRYVTLCGMTGSGKSVLAISAIRDQNLLKDCFNNCIYFINAGEARSKIDVANVLYRLGKIIDDQFQKDIYKSIDFETQGINLMTDELKRIFLKPEFKEALLVLDDASGPDIINAFNFGCKTLVTTQNMMIVPRENSSLIELNKGFSETESLQLFSKCTDVLVTNLPNEARQIHNLCKGAPLLIALIGSLMEPYKRDAADVDRWKYYVRMIIDKKDGWLAHIFRRRKNQERTKDYLFNTIKHCLEGLPEDYREYYKKFVLFVEDVNITSRVLEVVLDKTKYEVEDIVTELKNKSLIVYAYNKDLQCYVYGIHDLLLAHLKLLLNRKETIELHRSLIKNYLNVSGNCFANLPNDNYIFTYIGHHLVEADLIEYFPKVYFDLDFIGAKIKITGIADLVGDFKRYKKFITKDNDPVLSKKLEAFESFVQKYGQDLYEYPHTDIIQCGLQQPTDSEVYLAAMEIAQKHCESKLYLQTQFVGETVYVTHTFDLNEDVCAACFTNRTEYILVGTGSGEIRLWDHSYKSLLKSFQGHKNKITQLQVSPEATSFLSVSEDGCVKIWSLKNACLTHSGKTFDENGCDMSIPSPRVRQDSWVNFFGENGVMDESKTLEIKNDKLTAASFSNQNDEYIVTGSQKGEVIVWELDSLKQIFRIQHNMTTKTSITCCTFSCNDRLVLFACENLIFVYDLERSEYLSQFINDVRTHSLLIIHNTIESDSKIIAVSDKSLSIWCWQELQREGGGVKLENPDKILLDTHEDSIYVCAAVTWDGKYLVAGSSNRCINMWNIEEKLKVKEITQRSGGLVMCLDTFLNEEYNSNVIYILLSGSDDRSVKQWHIGPLENQNFLQAKLSLNFTTHWLEGQKPLTAAITSDNKIQVYSGLAILSETEELNNPTCLSFSTCGQELAIGFANGFVQVYNYSKNNFKSVMNLEGEICYLEYLRHANIVLLVASGVNGCLMIHTSGKSVRLKNRNKLKQTSVTMKCFLLHTARRLLSVDDDGCIKSWELDGISDVLVAVHFASKVTMATITPRQDKIAFTLIDGSFKVYSITQSAQSVAVHSSVVCSFHHDKNLDPDNALRSCCFSNDGRILAIGKDSGEIVLWNVVDMVELSVLKLHNSWVRNLYFSPPPVSGAPFVLISVADQIAWWDVSYICDKNVIQQKRRSGRRSRGSTSKPENLADLSITNDFQQMTLLKDGAWTGKCGRVARPELLSAIKLAGDYAAKISISPTFISFVTVDSSGLMYIMNVLKPNATRLNIS